MRPTVFTLESSELWRNELLRWTWVRAYLSFGVHLSKTRLRGERFIVDVLAPDSKVGASTIKLC